ncbi:MAG: phasin family protein [Pseudomonadota bacterium]
MAETKKTEKSADPFGITSSFSPESFKEGYEKVTASMTDYADFHRDAVDALIKSAGVFAKGVEKLTSENAAFAKAALDEGVSTAKSAASSGSVQEAMDIQAEFMRGRVEKNLNQINKVAEIFVETSKQASEPLAERYGQFVEKIQTYRP